MALPTAARSRLENYEGENIDETHLRRRLASFGYKLRYSVMLMKCQECGKDVSSLAASCPHCGWPVVASLGKPSRPSESPTSTGRASLSPPLISESKPEARLDGQRIELSKEQGALPPPLP